MVTLVNAQGHPSLIKTENDEEDLVAQAAKRAKYGSQQPEDLTSAKVYADLDNVPFNPNPIHHSAAGPGGGGSGSVTPAPPNEEPVSYYTYNVDTSRHANCTIYDTDLVYPSPSNDPNYQLHSQFATSSAADNRSFVSHHGVDQGQQQTQAFILPNPPTVSNPADENRSILIVRAPQKGKRKTGGKYSRWLALLVLKARDVSLQ